MASRRTLAGEPRPPGSPRPNPPRSPFSQRETPPPARDPQELHPELTPEERRGLFLRGVELFNDRRFFDCHEAFEEIWRSTTPEPRDLFQGLIQVAVGFYHYFERQRADVARRVMAKGRRRLEALRPEAAQEFGLEVTSWLEAVLSWEAWLAEPDGPAPEVPRLILRPLIEPDPVSPG